MKPRRVTPAELERIAFETRQPIEYGDGVAYLVVPGPPKREYVARLERAS